MAPGIACRTDRTTVRRLPEKAVDDDAIRNAILDSARVAHVAVIDREGVPYVLPVAYARDGERVLFHGSNASRLFRNLSTGAPTCLTVTLLDALVVARSAFESSMQYRSIMVFGTCQTVPDDDKLEALRLITEHLMPGRWDDVRAPHAKEVAATRILSLSLAESSVKVSDGPPDDPDDDLDAPTWAGVLPIVTSFGTPVDAPDLRGSHVAPAYLADWTPDVSYDHLSLWFDTLAEPIGTRPPLAGDLDADVVVVGGGYTGLWTAYYLLRADAGLRVVVLEAETVGFGASGRNGGWCSALFPAEWDKLARAAGGGADGEAAARAMTDAMHRSVDEVGRVVHEESIPADFVKGGTISLARTGVQLDRARAEVAGWHARGYDGSDHRLLDADEARARLGATDVLGASWTAHCARIHPGNLVRGLAEAVERLGGRIFEGTHVSSIEPGAARTPFGSVRAEHVVRATEGFTPALPGLHREVAPIYSLMVATEPLPDTVWERIGLREREAFNDHRHLIIYGQRTEDGRLAFGGRGAPYHFGSAVHARYDRKLAVFDALRHVLVDLFPVLGDVAITHTWGGPLGVTRDWYASVGHDPSSGLAWAGGYVGDGVGTSNLAGRTLADLLLGHDSDLTRLPWVGHRSPRWEPEPLRWLGVNAGLRVMTSADAYEERTGRPAGRADLMQRMLGG